MSNIRHDPVAPTRNQVLPAGGRVDAHRHDDDQLIHAGRGVLAVTTDEGSWVAPATRAIWVPAGVVHAHRAHGTVDLHLLGIPASINPMKLSRPTVLEVTPLLRELILACTRDVADTPERTNLLAVLFDQLKSSPEKPLHVPAPSGPLLRAVTGMLSADPGDGRTLAELGHAAGASERTLSRLFRSELGMTFPQWRTQLRLHHALILLAEDVPVTAVAHRCGWASASAFIDVFRRTFGHTPGAGRSR